MNELQIRRHNPYSGRPNPRHVLAAMPNSLQPTVFRLRHKRGFTLLELVVVIAILAVLSTVALRSMTGVASQARFEATQRTLDQVHEAILGAPCDRQPDGTLIISGFIADMGRPPTNLNELLSLPAGAPAFTVQRVPADPDVMVAGGWNGPYIRLPIGATTLCDGWGAPLIESPDGSGFLGTVSSYGADGLPGGTGYDLDLSCQIVTTNYTASLTGLVTLNDASASNGVGNVVVYGPGAASAVFPLSFAANSQNFAFSTLSHGPRAVRAYATYVTSTGQTNQQRSAVIYLNVHHGLNIQNLTIDRP